MEIFGLEDALPVNTPVDCVRIVVQAMSEQSKSRMGSMIALKGRLKPAQRSSVIIGPCATRSS